MRIKPLIAALLVLPACGSPDKETKRSPEATAAASAASAVKPLNHDGSAGPATARPNDAANADASQSAVSVSPCFMQGNVQLDVRPQHAVGTEPFWSAVVQGRCVTYSRPGDEKGQRVWTRYLQTPHGGSWSGVLGGKVFELRTRAAAGCSDGMSDKRFPMTVALNVNGEQRKGCAEFTNNALPSKPL